MATEYKSSHHRPLNHPFPTSFLPAMAVNITIKGR